MSGRLVLAALALTLAALPGWAQAQTPPPASATAPAPIPPTTVIREDGLVAEYYAADPAKAARGAVVVLGGSEGGLDGSRGIARQLASEGISAIAVSYFGEIGQAAKLDLIPIEPVDRALAWLTARPDANAEPIAILGASKGAELALLVASRNPAFKAVVAGVPSHVVWQGIDQTGGPTGSSWTAGGNPLAYVPYDLSEGFNGVYRLYADSLDSGPPEAVIPVERIAGPIFMVSGEADALAPCTEMANRIQRRLQDKGFGYSVTHLAYADAGHLAFGTPIPIDAPMLRYTLPFLGGTAPATVAARADSWPKVVAFLKAALAD